MRLYQTVKFRQELARQLIADPDGEKSARITSAVQQVFTKAQQRWYIDHPGDERSIQELFRIDDEVSANPKAEFPSPASYIAALAVIVGVGWFSVKAVRAFR